MNLLNASGMQAGYTLGLDKSGAERVVVAVKGTYTLPPRGNEAVKLADEQVPLIDADLFSGEPGYSAPLVECDYVPEKPLCDILLNGCAYAPGGLPVEKIAVGLQFGAMQKSFVACGDRVWRAGPAYLSAPAPAKFTRQPISYDTAFGGLDNWSAESADHRTYLENPFGRGWHRLTDHVLVDDTPIANTEERNDPVTVPNGKYRPMAFGPIGRGFPARIQHAGTYDQAWIDDVFPFLPADFDPLYFQCAPPDQRVEPPQGGERVSLINLTADGRRDFTFPSTEIPIVFFRRRADRVETKGRIDTVLFEPEAEKFTVVWRASLPLVRDVFEVTQIVVGKMSRAWWRSIETGKAYKSSLDVVVRERARERAL